MGTFNTIDDAREYFKNDKFCAEMGITIDELGEKFCVCSLNIKENHRNAVGGIMGGVIFSLADFAFSVASNHVHNVTVSLNATIDYLSASKGERLTARAECRKDGRTTCVYNVDITDEFGKDIAQFTGTGYKL